MLYAQLNEFISINALQTTLPSFLSAYSSSAWLSVGSLWWSSWKCRPETNKRKGEGSEGEGEGEEFWFERMVFRWPSPVCHDKAGVADERICLGRSGFRKVIVDPRKVSCFRCG